MNTELAYNNLRPTDEFYDVIAFEVKELIKRFTEVRKSVNPDAAKEEIKKAINFNKWARCD